MSIFFPHRALGHGTVRRMQREGKTDLTPCDKRGHHRYARVGKGGKLFSALPATAHLPRQCIDCGHGGRDE